MSEDIDRSDEFKELIAEDERREQAIRNGQHPDDPGPDESSSDDEAAVAEYDDTSELSQVKHAGHLGMAVKLAEQFSDQLLYVEKVGWHRWDGTRWAPGAA